ncbi:PLP-dependent aminotransferase family protein [Desertimonas flava]|uniref:MocR-like pyridoxine biosynthesis transcription factor PdxR n=1 Tax=Desertimonas flava TaxID=2064846 RepID=UPI000E34DCF5|nr:PLP-dependent aminotransferase family protein [Desertimonas flava]
MAIEWTGSGPDLLVKLDRSGDETLGAQLQNQLREAIRAGRLAAGERLPSSRMLARELDVSRGLVVDTYAQLEAEGYLDSRAGSATRVATRAVPAVPPAPAGEVRRRPTVDFDYGVPDLAGFPMKDWLWALGEAAKSAPFAALGNDEHRGMGELREVVAAYLRRVRGADVDADNVVICSGFAQGLGVVAAALKRLGIDTVAAEDPRSLDTDASIERIGSTVVSVPVDGRGIDVERLAATSARAVVVTPAHQAPTGVLLAPERRKELIAWAIERDAFVIEDDYDAEFRYDRQPVGAMQGLSPCQVVAIGSVSKSLAPGLRLGWIVCPAELTPVIAREKEIADRGSPALDQLALAHMIRSGRYDRHLRRMRTVYAARREALVAALAEHAPCVRVSGLAAGFHAVLDLAEGADERAIVAAALERSVGVQAMSRWRSSGATVPPQLVIGFGNVTESAIGRGIETIADLLTSAPGSPAAA